MHRELQTLFVEPHARAGTLAVEGQGHFRSVRQVECQVVRPFGAHSGTGGEHALRWLAKCDGDDPLPFGETFAGAQVEGHAGPAPVVDGALQCDEGLGVRLGVDTLLAAVAGVLPADHLARRERQHAAKHLVLLFADGRGLQRRRRLHRHERKNLKQVSHHHVAKRSHGFIERRALAEPQRLRHVNLHVVDEIAVPDGLKESVGEAEREDVLRRLLAEEVVDAKYLSFVEYLVQFGVQRYRARKVSAERLFHDDAGALDESGVAEEAHRRQGSIRWDAQIMQATALGAERLLRGRYGRLEGGRARREGHVIEILGKGIPVRRTHLTRGELVECAAHFRAQALRVQVLQRHTDDAAPRDEPGGCQVEEARPELAAREVTRRTEKDHDLWILRTLAWKNFCHRALPLDHDQNRERADSGASPWAAATLHV